MIQAKYDDILDVLKLRFNKIPDKLISKIRNITDIEKLNELHRKAVISKSLAEFTKFVSNSK